MAIQKINIGNVVNDGLGDDLRTAFQKVNANFSDLNFSLTITAGNIGGIGAGIFNRKNGNVLEFKSITAGTGIAIEELPETIRLTSKSFTTIGTDTNTVLANFSNNISIKGGLAVGATVTSSPDIVVTGTGSEILIKNSIPVTDILTTFDFGSINGEYSNVIQLLLTSSNIDFGTIDFPGFINLNITE